MSLDSGSPRTDASYDFNRARRRQALARLAALARRETLKVLRYEDVVGSAGYLDERELGVQVVRLDAIVGTVDRPRDFDRAFRPTSSRSRERWERIAAAYRSGQALPPIHVRRVGELLFVVDGHHRVSAARAIGLETLDARVTEVRTRLEPATSEHELQTHERLFAERVPLPAEAHARIRLATQERYASLAEGVEAWGARHMLANRELLTREEIAGRWFHEYYEPTVALLAEAGLVGRAGETEAFIAFETQRYLLLFSHAPPDDAMLERLRKDL